MAEAGNNINTDASLDSSLSTLGNIGDQMRALVPAEVTGVFLALNANFRNSDDENIIFLVFFVILVIFSIFYTRFFVRDQGWPSALLVSVVIFPAWALMIAYNRIDFFGAYPNIVTGIMLILGLLVPFIAAAIKSSGRRA
ncbi:hypothetical protein [Parasphingorhabdus sp.]|uniref:hypothetical protein n=1 Tax=Parasphingorhabdus sp. TaxID=2709688 RepID=UPI003A936310